MNQMVLHDVNDAYAAEKRSEMIYAQRAPGMTNMFKHLAPIAMISAACAISGCASTTPTTNPNGSQSVVSETQVSHEGRGELALQNGQAWMATNLFKEAVARHNTQQDRFNLASAYDQTGRYAEAAHYYQSVIDDGTPSSGQRIANTQIPNDKSDRVIDVVAESRARLTTLGRSRSESATFSKASTVGGPKSGDVSDKEARRLDSIALAAAK